MYTAALDPRINRYVVSDPQRGVIPVPIPDRLAAEDFARLLNCIATSPPEDQPLEKLCPGPSNVC